MIDPVQNFLMSINKRGHVLKLIEKLELNIRLVMDQKDFVLAFTNGAVSLLDHTKNTEVTISGHQESVSLLVEGKEKLRSLIKEGQLQVAASFRAVLLLESIFYLTKAES
nr:SCP2 sterol-binding domain-containing protein [Neobacillus sp. Marseille-Q6967]